MYYCDFIIVVIYVDPKPRIHLLDTTEKKRKLLSSSISVNQELHYLKSICPGWEHLLNIY